MKPDHFALLVSTGHFEVMCVIGSPGEDDPGWAVEAWDSEENASTLESVRGSARRFKSLDTAYSHLRGMGWTGAIQVIG